MEAHGQKVGDSDLKGGQVLDRKAIAKKKKLVFTLIFFVAERRCESQRLADDQAIRFRSSQRLAASHLLSATLIGTRDEHSPSAYLYNSFNTE